MQTMNPQLDPDGYKIAQLSYYTMLEGPGYDMLRDYADKQLLIMGLREPDNEQEMMMMQQRQQQQAMQSQQENEIMMQSVKAESSARLMEGQAAMMNEQNDAVKNQIEMQKAETGRMKVIIDAEKAGADINIKQQDYNLKEFEAQVNAQEKMMSGMMGQSR